MRENGRLLVIEGGRIQKRLGLEAKALAYGTYLYTINLDDELEEHPTVRTIDYEIS